MRLATALGALAIGAGGISVTTLPRPTFPGPAGAPSGPHRLVLVSSRSIAYSFSGTPLLLGGRFRGLLAQESFFTANRTFVVYGTDGATGRYLVAQDKTGHQLFAFDFKNYAWPPHIKLGDREFVYEQPQWAQERGGILYVETTHLTYARSSYDQNAYITAIDLKTRKTLWRSPALVANARTFLVTPHYLVTGYGFTDERDYLYLLDRSTGRVIDRLSLSTAPELIGWYSGLLRILTYDHRVLVRLRGA